MNILFSPHSDDAVLYACFTLLREKLLVVTVTSSFVQSNRGENLTAEQRRIEDIEAMKILGCPIIFGNIRDDIIDEWTVKNLLERFKNFETVYAPAIQGGNPHHDLVGKVAQELFGDKVKQYSTYAQGQFYTSGTIEVKPTPEEIELKNKALDCYVSQINLPATKPHFEAVMKGQSEWFM